MNTQLIKSLALRPSSADRWMVCPASASRAADAPSFSSPAADEGIAAHIVAEAAIYDIDLKGVEAGMTMAQAFGGEMDERVSDSVVTQDMMTGATAYARFVNMHYGNMDEASLLTEAELALGWYWTKGKRGIADAIVTAGDKLHVFDYKFGKSEVSAQENMQLSIYAISFIVATRKTLPEWNPDSTLHIVQPRAGGIRSWNAGDMTNLQDKIKSVAELAKQGDNAPALAGRHCFFCAAAPFCVERIEAGQRYFNG